MPGRLRSSVAWLSRRAINQPRLAGPVVAVLESLDMRIDVPGTGLTMRVGSAHETRRAASLLTKEPETIRWLDQEFGDDDVLYDVGANIGVYSLYAGLRGRGTVYAFEPVPSSYAHLVQNVVDNGLADRVIALPLALSSRTGTGSLALSTLAPGAASHGLALTRAAAAHLATVEYRIDDLDLPTPTLIKIDVDGTEVGVLDGARRALSDPKLRSVLVETDAHLVREVDDRMRTAGFELDHLGEERPNATNRIYRRSSRQERPASTSTLERLVTD